MANLYIIAGCNGAGKTTASYTVLPEMLDCGNDIPDEVVRRRYWAGIKNLTQLYLPICDYWAMIDNSTPPFQILAERFKNNHIKIFNHLIYNQIVSS